MSSTEQAYDEATFEAALADLIREAETAGVDLTAARDVDGADDDGFWMVEISRVAGGGTGRRES